MVGEVGCVHQRVTGRLMKVGAKSTPCPIADDRLGRTRSSLELTFQRNRHRKLSQRGGILSIRRRPSCLSCFPTMPPRTAISLLRARESTLPSSRIADIFLICLIVFLDRFMPPESLARPLAPARTACENPLICSQLLMIACEFNVQALHIGLVARACKGCALVWELLLGF
jgi:hypothetical protein